MTGVKWSGRKQCWGGHLCQTEPVVVVTFRCPALTEATEHLGHAVGHADLCERHAMRVKAGVLIPCCELCGHALAISEPAP